MSLAKTVQNLATNNSTLTVNGTTYSNHSNIPRELALLIIHNSAYDGRKTSETLLSVSDLMVPVRKTILKIKNPKPNTIVDVLSLSKPAYGTMLHNSLEEALSTDSDYILEKRTSKTVLDIEISGKFDLVHKGTLKDLKTTSSYSLMLLAEERRAIGTNQLTLQELYENHPLHFKYIFQLSAYHWLNPDLITDSYGYILFHLTDNGGFNKLPIDSEKRFKLFSLKDTEAFITNRVEQIKSHLLADTMPDCTETERGFTPPQYKVVRLNKTLKWLTVKGTKTDSLKTAQRFLLSEKAKPTDKIDTTPATYRMCEWCNFNSICEQNKGN